MAFSRKDHLVGLDIGASFIKVAEIQKTPKGNSLKKFGMIPVAHGAIVDGRIMDMPEVANTIRSLFKSLKIREKKVAISTGGHSVVIKTINTAKVPERDLQQAISAEAEQYIPYDMDDVNIDYQILGESEFSSEQMNILLVAVKKDLVAEYMALTAMAGLKASIIDVDTFALQNIYETLPGLDPEELTLLLDVGASKTSLNIVKNNISLIMQDNGSGTFQIIQELAERTETDFPAAEKILLDPVSDTPDTEILAAVLQQAAEIWCSEIVDAVHTFLSNTQDARINRIVVSGGGSYIQPFVDRLETKMGARVFVIEPFAGLNLDKKTFPPAYLSQVGPLAPIALGLALRRVDDK
ncbi:MAG: type IV pilus assembly protein PilM [Desulfotignum sp.]|nr:type IV pilus assembly protein PilM [Desulfotignum sp.]